MDKILDDYLCKTFPKIFEERKLNVMESCMGRGFECNRGWFLLIYDLCNAIQRHIDIHNKFLDDGEKEIPQFVALQVKEKLGCLTVYYRGGDDYCRGLVGMADVMSYRTCESCGKFGLEVGRTENWLSTLCTKCAEKREKSIVYDKELKELMEKVRKEMEIK